MVQRIPGAQVPQDARASLDVALQDHGYMRRDGNTIKGEETVLDDDTGDSGGGALCDVEGCRCIYFLIRLRTVFLISPNIFVGYW